MSRSGRTTVISAALMLALAILYPLAAGPLVYMKRIGRPVVSVEAFLWIYRPLNYVEAKVKPVGLAMQFYVDFWERAARQYSEMQADKTAQTNG
jgi:hypothetical protein